MKVVAILWLLFVVRTTYSITTDTTCTNSQYYNIGSLGCASCQTNEVSSANGRSCVCAAGYASVLSNGAYSCIDCISSNQTSLSDRSACISCDGSTGAVLDLTTRDCKCPSGKVLVEKNTLGAILPTGKICLSCPTNSWPSSTIPHTCVPCPHQNMTAISEGVCECASGFVKSGSTCILKTSYDSIASAYPIDSANTLYFRDLKLSMGSGAPSTEILQSATIGGVFAWAAANCKTFRTPEACQALGNLCVLSVYDSQSSACRLYDSLYQIDVTNTNGYTGWPKTLPWLYHRDDSQSTLEDTAIRTKVSLETKTLLNFYLSAYALNGTWLGFEPLKFQFQLCPGSPSDLSRFSTFGTSFSNKCNFNLLSLLSADPTVFYDLYFRDSDGSLKPVPVQIMTDFSQKDSDAATANLKNLKLYRRFFVYDNIGAIRTAGGSPSILRVAEIADLRVWLQKDVGSRIYIPLLTLRYTSRQVSALTTPLIQPFELATVDTQSLGTPEIFFTATYTMDLSTFFNGATAALIVFLILSLILTAFKLTSWYRMRRMLMFDLGFLLRLFLFGLETCSTFLFFFLFGICGYLYASFRSQSDVKMLLPTSNQLNAFVGLLVFCLVGKIIHVAHILYEQTHLDLFFIDWEKSRAKLTSGLTQQQQDQQQEGGGDDSNPPSERAGGGENQKLLLNNNKFPGGGGGSGSRKLGGANNGLAPVSVWRTILVGNEWNKLQTFRVINTRFTLFSLVLFLEGLNYSNFARGSPTTSPIDTPYVPVHPVLRFAVTCFFWIMVSAGQVILHRLFYKRFVRDHIMQFVDVCSLANISVIVFQERYAGYYIHGRSVHPHADANMAELNEYLRREASGGCSKRGLLEQDPTELQTFQMFVLSKIRDKYDACLINESKKSQQQQMLQYNNTEFSIFERFSIFGLKRELPSAKAIAAYNRLNEYLQGFVNKIQSSPDAVLEKGPWHRFCGLPPDSFQINKNMFFRDPQCSFTTLLLHGHELNLLIFLMLVYGIIDFGTQSTAYSVVLTFLIDWFVVWLRSRYGRLNTSEKALLDERYFL